VDRKKLYGFAVHQTHVLEIESQCTAFLFQEGPKRVHVVSCDPPTDAQNHTMLSDCLALDFAGHCKCLNGIVSELASLESKSLATRNLLKTKGQENVDAGAHLANHANSANSTSSASLIAMREYVQRNLNWSLLIFKALMRVSRVDGGIPSFAAAPDGPETLPLVAARAASIISRSLSGST
jgi:hypothetical protein